MSDAKPSPPQSNHTRKPYSPPRVRTYGSIQSMTLASATADGTDGAGAMPKKTI